MKKKCVNCIEIIKYISKKGVIHFCDYKEKIKDIDKINKCKHFREDK